MYLYVVLSIRKYVRNVTVLLNISSKTPYPWDGAHVTVLHFTLDSRNVKPFFVDPYSLFTTNRNWNLNNVSKRFVWISKFFIFILLSFVSYVIYWYIKIGFPIAEWYAFTKHSGELRFSNRNENPTNLIPPKTSCFNPIWGEEQ